MAKLFTFIIFIVILFLAAYFCFSLIRSLIKWIDKDAELRIDRLQKDYDKRLKEEMDKGEGEDI